MDSKCELLQRWRRVFLVEPLELLGRINRDQVVAVYVRDANLVGLDLVERDDFGGKNFPCGLFHEIDGPGRIVGLFQFEFEGRHHIKNQGLEQEFVKQNFVWLLLFVKVFDGFFSSSRR